MYSIQHISTFLLRTSDWNLSSHLEPTTCSDEHRGDVTYASIPKNENNKNNKKQQIRDSMNAPKHSQELKL